MGSEEQSRDLTRMSRAPQDQGAYAPWLDPECSTWNIDVEAWLDQAGRVNGLGPVVHQTVLKARPWSMVARVELERAVTYFKACGRGGRHEPQLLEYLEQGAMRGAALRVPRRLAVNEANAWMLLADAGAPMREAAGSGTQITVLKRLLPLYGEMQLASIPDGNKLIEMGLPDRRPLCLPGLLEALLADPVFERMQSATQTNPLRDAAQGLVPALDRCCRAIATAPYAAALDHGDLHTGNFLVQGDSCCLADWGDACVGYPFCSLGMLLETALGGVAEPERPAIAAQLVAAYLEPWRRVASAAALQVEIEAALWIAHVVRALDLAHMCREKDEAVGAEWQSFLVDALAKWVAMPLPALARIA